MRHVHRMTLRMLPGPFLGWLSVLMFLLVMQFLIKYLPDLVGKGLPIAVIVELISYNLAYMLVLAVPMSVLIAALMTFGRLAETGSFAVMKSAGISFVQIVWPFLLLGVMLTAAMGYFNNRILPEANFRARALWQDIRVARPGFDLKPGVFYDGLDDYMILVRKLPRDNPERIEDVTIYDYSEGAAYRTDIKAAYGTIHPDPGGGWLRIDLHDGEIHRKRPSQGDERERYERLAFRRHRLRIELPEMGFERTDPAAGDRTDRTMNSTDLRHMVDSLETGADENRARIREHTIMLGAIEAGAGSVNPLPNPTGRRPYEDPYDHPALVGLDSVQARYVYDSAIQEARAGRSVVENARHFIQRSEERADQLRVEIHKKNSIALACLIFMLIGAPLGLSIRRGGLATAAAIAIGIFLFYWVTLVNGEKLADRALLTPWVGMWAANIIAGIAGLWLTLRVALDRRATPSRWARIRDRLFAMPGATGLASES